MEKKIAAVQENLKQVQYTLTVASGKGGVGKSTLCLILARYFSQQGYSVGILDADIHGPNIPVMLGVDTEIFQADGDRVIPIAINENISIASVACIGYGKNEALVWRGPMKLSIIRQFLETVEWGARDILLIDTPPGTGDEVLTIAEYLPSLSGWIAVTTPQGLSLADARRSIDFARKLQLPVLGVVENMCDSDSIHLFGRGGGEKIAEEFGVSFLGSIPIIPDLVSFTERGTFLQFPFSDAVDIVAANVLDYLQG